jgi:NitT/TauT family transport system permease protein
VRRVAPAILLCALAAALQLACAGRLVSPAVIIPPSAMFASLWTILRSGLYTHAILRTLGDVALAAIIAIAAGFALGAALHGSAFLRRGVEPYLASYYAVPTIIFYPVFIVMFGVGSAAIVAIAVLLAIVAMMSATLAGLDRMPPVFGRTARLLRLSPLQRALRVQLPAAAPALMSGVRLAVAYAFIGVIASEFILSGDGLGYAIAAAYNEFDNATMYGLMLLIVVVVAAVNGALGLLDRRLHASRG